MKLFSSMRGVLHPLTNLSPYGIHDETHTYVKGGRIPTLRMNNF